MSGPQPRPRIQSFKSLPAWGSAEAPPTSFLLFAYGPTQASKFGGEHFTVYLTTDNAKAIVQEWARRSIRGHFDYDHAILQDNPGGTPSAGAFDLEVRADGLWVVNIEWTPRMLKYFKDKEIQYTSPFFDVITGPDGNDYVTEIHNVAVTNWPATDNLRPLIALNKRGLGASKHMDPKAQEAIKAILDKLISDGKDANTAQAILDIQAALSGAADPNANPADPNMPAMAEIAQTARALTGKVSPADVKGVLQAAFNAKAETKTLNDRIQALETKEALDLIDRSTLTPASKVWAAKQLSQPAGYETVKSFIEASAKDAPVGPHVVLVKPPVVEAKSDEVSPEMIAFCKAKDLEPKTYLKHWTALNKGKSWSRELA
jgi:phage I-like protein